uniref:Kelch-like protein 7 n=1 Tax=Magallana gigas TaxID=29159 RepID=K1PSB6_MAGGI
MGGSIDRGGKKVVLKTVECYDPKLNCWVRKRSLPRPLCHACVLEVNNYLFLLGGATQEEPGGDMVSSNVVYRYSRLSEVWTEFTEMITPRHDAGAVAVEVLDCETATWEEENEEEFRPVIGVACVLMPRL